MSSYPNSLDTNLTVPQVEDGVTETTSEAFNDLRDAVLNLERYLGIGINGNLSSLADRIKGVIDADGNFLPSSLHLSIVDVDVNSAADIQESKLALDYSTATLKSLIDSVNTTLATLISGYSTLSVNLGSHESGIAYRHDGYAVDCHSIAGLTASTVGDALNQLSALLLAGSSIIQPHMDLSLPSTTKHRASGISVDTTTFGTLDRNAITVQTSLDSVDELLGSASVEHLGEFHSNGVLKASKTGDVYNAAQRRLGPVNVVYTHDTQIITFPGTTSFAALGVTAGDIVVVYPSNLTTILDVGSFQVRAVGPLTDPEVIGDLPILNADQLAVFHTFAEDSHGGVEGAVYEPAFIDNQYAPLACALRDNGSTPDTISVLMPNAARVVSIGFNGAIMNSDLSGDGYELCIRAGVGNGYVRELIIPHINYNRLTGMAVPVTSKSVAERINAYVSDGGLAHHFPVTAFRVGDELALAHNWIGADYTLEVLDGYNGNYPCGLDLYGANVCGQVVVGNESNGYVVNGQVLRALRVAFDGYMIASGGADNVLYTLAGQEANPLDFGIAVGSVIHISGHSVIDANGSYTVEAVTTTSVSTFGTDLIPVSIGSSGVVNVKFLDSHISLYGLFGASKRGLVEVYVDSDGETLLNQKAVYGTALGSAVEVVGVSDGFPASDVDVYSTLAGSQVSFQMQYNPPGGSLVGDIVTVLNGFTGEFKLYHPNGLDYFVMRLSAIVSASHDTITVSNSLPAKENLLLGTAHYDGTNLITNLTDNRLFGTIAADQIRDDYTELVSQRPVRDLRSNGVVYGFDEVSNGYVDGYTGMPSVTLSGGVAYVDGVRLAVETQRVIVPGYDSTGAAITANLLLAIDTFGSLQVVSYDLGDLLTTIDGYASSAAFGKLLPMYRVVMTAGKIVSVLDIRFFVGALDAKMELVVDGYGICGSFKSLEGALYYASKYPNNRRLTIRIVDSVAVTTALTVPDGVSILGGAAWGGNGKHQIVCNTTLGSPVLTFSGNNRLENVEVVGPAALNKALVLISGSNVNIEKCKLSYSGTVVSGDVAILTSSTATNIDRLSIANNRIDNAYAGIRDAYGVGSLTIERNELTNILGPCATPGTFGIAVNVLTSVAAKSVIIRNNHISKSSVHSGILVGTLATPFDGYVTIEGNELVGLGATSAYIDGYFDGYMANGTTPIAISILNNTLICANGAAGYAVSVGSSVNNTILITGNVATGAWTTPLLDTSQTTNLTTGHALLAVGNNVGIVTPWYEIGVAPAPSFGAGWSNTGGGFYNAAYTKDASGWVHLRGLVNGTLGTTLFTLPVGFRPSSAIRFSTLYSTDSFACGSVDTTGIVTPGGSGAVLSFGLDGVSFYVGW